MVPKADYTVESKEELRKRAKDGAIEVWYRIWATSKKGTYFSVEVPAAHLSRADSYLTARAQELDAI